MAADVCVLDRFLGLSFLYGAPILMFAVSITYFLLDRNNSDLANRLVYSSHGFAAAILFVGAVVIGATKNQASEYAMPFFVLHAVPLALILVSFVRYRGPKIVHLLQVPNLAAMVWSILIGTMAITGNSL